MSKAEKYIEYIRECSFQLSTPDPYASTDDLEPLREIIGGARLVGMGEATHGSKEFTVIRRRLLRFLVEDMGFNGLIIETPQEQAMAIDTFIKTGDGNPKQLLSELGYWVHNTQEMLDVIEWMRRYNSQSATRRLSFMGCDIPIDDERRDGDYSLRDKAMSDLCVEALDSLGGDAKAVLWSHNMHVSSISDGITTQGHFLKQKLGDNYKIFLSLFNEGQFNAVGWDESLDKATGFGVFEAPKAPSDTYEYTFAATGLPLAIFDIQKAKEILTASDTRLNAHKVRDVGSVYDPMHPERIEHKADLSAECDGVIWIDKITSATPL